MEAVESKSPEASSTQTQNRTGTDDERKRVSDLAEFHRSIGKRYAGCTLRNFDTATDAQVKALAQVERFVRSAPENDGGLLIVGPPGTGKDHLAAAAASACIVRYGMSVRWINGVEWYARQRDRIDAGHAERDEVLRLMWSDVLIVSDPLPPDASLTSYQSQLLYQVIEGRYRARRQTWATINVLGKDDFRRRMTGPTADRLMDGAVLVQCYWPSHRKLAKGDE